MILLSIPMFVWVWAIAGLLALGGIGLFYLARDVRRRRHREKVRVFCCGACGRVYVGKRDADVTACPACGHPNPASRRP